VLDVAADIRKGTPAFGRHAAIEIRTDNWWRPWVPSGTPLGFRTQSGVAGVPYMVIDDDRPPYRSGSIWNDPDLASAWPRSGGGPVLSETDARASRLAKPRHLFD
jgi:dTDP-4-dehydrorhamnose 3,5-epimerase